MSVASMERATRLEQELLGRKISVYSMSNFSVRWMTRRDAEDVLRINAESPSPFPGEADLCNGLLARNRIAMVAESGHEVVGFMVYLLHKDCVELEHIAVSESHRRNGAGRALLAKIVSKLSERHKTAAIVDVPAENLAAQLFFRACKWRCVGERSHSTFGSVLNFIVKIGGAL